MEKIGQCDIRKIADHYGTPVYVYDKQKIISNYLKLLDAFRSYYPGTHIHYSVKANSNLYILKVFKKLGAGVDCSSPFELLTAMEAGFSNEEIIYTGNYESHEDFAIINRTKPIVNMDDINSFRRMKGVFSPEIVGYRINPGIGRGGHEGITTGGTDAKFGIPYEKALYAYKAALDHGYKRFGIHMMTGSNNLEPYYFAETLEKLMKIAGKVFNQLNIIPEYVDIGGGFGIPYNDHDEELNIDETARLVTEIFTEKCAAYNFGQPRLLLEPGRYLVADAGYLVSKVTGIKKSYKNFAGLDAGMNTLIRPALYGAQHRINVYKKHVNEESYHICGQICENSDIFAQNRILPVLEEGDLLIFRDTGAYGYAMSSNYNSRPRPAEVLVNEDLHQLIRRRETFEDFLRLYP